MAKVALAAMSVVLRIREAESEAARGNVLAADAAAGLARDKHAGCLGELDAAENSWRTLLGGRSHDPALVGLAAGWLVESERTLGAAKLDAGIAEHALEAAADAYSMARSRLDASRQIHDREVRKVAGHREAGEMAEVSDAFLRRRRI